MHDLIAELTGSGVVVADGAWGTELQAKGIIGGSCPAAWNLTHPDVVESVATAYVRAGSRIILTNSFGASSIRLGDYGLADRARDINVAAAAISRRAADRGDGVLVFASIGPTGKMLLTGDVSEEQLAATFTAQAAALADGGADGLVVETMMDTVEACLAVTAAKATGLPVVASMVFNAGRDHDRTMMGVTPEQAATALLAAGADVVGANCGQGPGPHTAICRRLKLTPTTPVWIKPNAGLPDVNGGVTRYTMTAADFAAAAATLAAAGANFIGGCCGSSPAFVQALRERLG